MELGELGPRGPLSGRRIGLLTASASRLGGGVFEAVVKQAEMIRRQGGEAVVFGLEDAFSAEDAPRFSPSPVHHAPVVGPAQVGYSPRLIRQLEDAELDLLHLHGIWMYPSRAATVWRRRTGRPYVVSPHGMLDPWITGRGRAKKALARIGYERASWRAATRLHGLTAREAADIARESGRTDSVVITNAGPRARAPEAVRRGREFLYLGRIHPKKNIGALVAAWTAGADRMNEIGASLTIAGWGEDAHVDELRAQLARAPSSVRFVGPLYGAAKADAFARASFFTLPSLSEGLPMVVLEAWAAATPVLMTTECNLPEGFAAGAALDCGFDPASIGACLDLARAMPDEQWLAMSRAAHRLAAVTFSAEVIEARWARCYAALIAGEEP